uniref:Kelch like family member 34 n=1 Tax=Scleropages formosus TaxID=113540 RepID=A0A8C9WF46_SCLFO
MSYFLVMSKEHGDGVLSQYQRLRSQGLLCDLVLVAADGTQFPAHRSLLACSGDYFWSMFKEHTYEFRAQRVELPAISSKGLESILDFIYTSWLSLSICTLEDTLEAANYLQVTRAVDLCVKYMRDNLSVDNCCFFANVAARYGVDDALAAANSFIGCHMGELLGPGGDRVGLLELNLDSLRSLNYHSQGARQPLLQNNQTSLRSRTCQVFYPERRKFQHLTDLPSRVQHHCACTVGNFLFVLGGEVVKLSEDEKVLSAASSNQVWRYDPRFRCWEVASPMTERRVQFSCCVSQGNIYAIGGRRGKGASLDSVEMYDLRANRWLRAAALPCAMFAQACVSYKGAVYLSGGVHAEQRVSSNEVYRLEPQEGRWTKCAAMGIARSGHQMAVLQDNIYAFLGMYEPFCDIERYDPALDQWTRLRPLLSDRFCYGLVQLESTALLVGGRKWHSGREVATPNVLEYEPESDSWREVCKLPKPLSGTQCALMQLPTPLDLKTDGGGIHEMQQ